MYGLLAFIIFSFGLLSIVIISEIQSDQGNSFLGDSVATRDGDQMDTTNDITSIASNDFLESKNELPDDQNMLNTLDKDKNSSEKKDEEASIDTVEEKESTLLFAGDIYLSDYVLDQYNQNNLSGILSESLQKEFNDATISMVNQEFAFSNGGVPMEDKLYTFRVNPSYVQIFNEMNIDIVTLANNHTLDFGTIALQDSILTLQEAGIEFVGAGNTIDEAKEIKYVECDYKKIAFLGASRVIPVTNWNAGTNAPGLLTTYDPTILIAQIQEAKTNSDFVVVYVHWGIERNQYPEEYQKNLAKQYIDAGADVIIGSHPHVLQGIEYYNGKPIVYSLGNFIFYNTIEQTALVKIYLDDNMEIKIQILPCTASGAKTSLIENESVKQEFYETISNISFGVTIDQDGFVYEN